MTGRGGKRTRNQAIRRRCNRNHGNLNEEGNGIAKTQKKKKPAPGIRLYGTNLSENRPTEHADVRYVRRIGRNEKDGYHNAAKGKQRGKHALALDLILAVQIDKVPRIVGGGKKGRMIRAKKGEGGYQRGEGGGRRKLWRRHTPNS